MTFFAATYTYTDATEEIAATRPRHRAFLNELHKSGQLRASGPLPETNPAQALLIMTCSDADEVRQVLAADPFQVAGLVADLDVTPWIPAVGVFADELSA